MKAKNKKAFLLMVVIVAPILLLCLHDTRPWNGTPIIYTSGRTLVIGSMGWHMTAGGSRPMSITSTTYYFQGNGGYLHTSSHLTIFNAPLGLWAANTWNNYDFGPLRVCRIDSAYSSVDPRTPTKDALQQSPESHSPLIPPPLIYAAE